MAYESIDRLQKALTESVFHYAKDPKKAAGRALGTLVEIITFYLLKSWKLTDCISIERSLAEYGNPEISHNVEYSLHPILKEQFLTLGKGDQAVTAGKIVALLSNTAGFEKKTTQLLTKENVLRNACTVATSERSFLVANITDIAPNQLIIKLIEQHRKPFAMFECKRVGVEEGMSKGPQTIEKAKQGAYVARTASSLQKIRTEKGEMHGIVYKSDHSFVVKPYIELMEEVIKSEDTELLRKFILTVGVVSNHGNWFTSDNQNKELKVLAQSYDWLLFLTDAGLAEFIESLILNPQEKYQPIRAAFLASYTGEKVKNQFTKVQMKWEADRLLQDYFAQNLGKIEAWFNIISPAKRTLDRLKTELETLKNKNWGKILT